MVHEESHYTPAQLAMFARRNKLNKESMLAFLAAILALTSIFILFHYIRRAGRYFGSRKPTVFVSITRRVRSLFNRKMPGLPSTGHAFVVFLYVAINVIITFTNIDTKNMPLTPNMASRTGWMAIVNMVLVIFLSLKNTPLAVITPWSYERLNVLHQVSGYTTVAFVIIHTSCYTYYFIGAGRTSRLLWTDEIYGMVAGISFLMLGFVGAVVRRFYYELFYYLHILFTILALTMVGLHQPEVAKKAFIATSLAGAIWVADRLVRFCRLMAYSTNNTATLTPLPHGGTRVTLAKAPIGADSGKHGFLWIPAVRKFETHPFTIAAMNPLEFVVASYDGFTCDLHKYAVEHPGATLKASVEGAYGTLPDPVEYDKVVLVAGGSGASFTFGVLQSMLRRLKEEDKKHVTFVWIVKHQSYVHWYLRDLRNLLKDSRVSVQIYVTRGSSSELPSPAATSDIQTETTSPLGTSGAVFEKQISVDIESPQSNLDLEKTLPSESESNLPMDTSQSIHSMPVIYQRPNVELIIRSAVEEADSQSKIVVMGCGPNGLMDKVRNVTAACIRPDGPAVELHCEQFGW